MIMSENLFATVFEWMSSIYLFVITEELSLTTISFSNKTSFISTSSSESYSSS